MNEPPSIRRPTPESRPTPKSRPTPERGSGRRPRRGAALLATITTGAALIVAAALFAGSLSFSRSPDGPTSVSPQDPRAVNPNPQPEPSDQAGSFLDARAYGARGDGRTDDTKAIQSALDAAVTGEIVYLPPGVYVVGRKGEGNFALRIPDGVGLTGAQPVQMKSAGNKPEIKESVLRLADNEGPWTRLLLVSGAENVTVSHLVLDGNGKRQEEPSEQRHALFIQGSRNVLIEGVTIRDTTGDGVYFHDESGGVVAGSAAYGGQSSRVGFNFQGGRGVLFRDNYVEGYSVGFKAEVDEGSPDVRDIVIRSNRTRNTSSGVVLNGNSEGGFVYDVVVEGNDFDFSNEFGFWIKDTLGLIVRGNTIRQRSGGAGFYVRGHVEDALVEQNVVRGSKTGVDVYEYRRPSQNLTFRNNFFPDAETGVWIHTPGAVRGLRFCDNRLPAAEILIQNQDYAEPPLALEGNILRRGTRP